MININKTYRTRDGREVRIYAMDGVEEYPVHGAVRSTCGGWYSATWTMQGEKCKGNSTLEDLVEVKPRIQREYWINMYPQGGTNFYNTREFADKYTDNTRIACVRVLIDCEEGEGL